MRVIKSEHKLCLSCMEKHNVDIVQIVEQELFKNEEVDFIATYEHCSITDELSEAEDMIRANSLAVKDAYRIRVGLLTSDEIKNIREKYGISQKDFSQILDWGMATITRYENHQVQDRAHDDILRKIDSDPKWLRVMLKRAKGRLSQKAFTKYYHKVNAEYRLCGNQYLIEAIYAIYANFEDPILTGCMDLRLDKVIEVINYLSKKVHNLHMVKLMKLLWYSDVYNYKRHGYSITGLAYSVLPRGAVPKGYEQIVSLDGIKYDLVLYDDIAYKFKTTPGFKVRFLSDKEIASIDKIISELGKLSTPEIVERMHKEEAYKKTPRNKIISYIYAESLSIS